jgi:hypothetical protein
MEAEEEEDEYEYDGKANKGTEEEEEDEDDDDEWEEEEEEEESEYECEGKVKEGEEEEEEEEETEDEDEPYNDEEEGCNETMCRMNTYNKDKEAKDLRSAVVYAIYELEEWDEDPVVSRDYAKCRMMFLARLNSMRRDVMGEYISNTLSPYCDRNQTWQEKKDLVKKRIKDKNKNHRNERKGRKGRNNKPTLPTNPKPILLTQELSKKEEDEQIQEAIQSINSASFETIKSWLSKMLNECKFKCKSTATGKDATFTQWDMISYLVAGNVNRSKAIQSRAKVKKYGHTLQNYQTREMIGCAIRHTSYDERA